MLDLKYYSGDKNNKGNMFSLESEGGQATSFPLSTVANKDASPEGARQHASSGTMVI